MTDHPQKPVWQKVLVSLVLTSGLTAVAYGAWTYASIGTRKLAGETLLTDMRFFIGLLAVFLTLTILDLLIGLVKSKLDDGP